MFWSVNTLSYVTTSSSLSHFLTPFHPLWVSSSSLSPGLFALLAWCVETVKITAGAGWPLSAQEYGMHLQQCCWGCYLLCPSMATKTFKPCFSISRNRSFGAMKVGTILSDSCVGMSPSLKWTCRLLNSICITVGQVLNVSSCLLIHQQCLASQLGASQELQSTWAGGMKAVGCGGYQEHAQGCFTRTTQHLWEWLMLPAVVWGQVSVSALKRHIYAQGMCVCCPRGGVCCVAGCALGLLKYWECSDAGSQNHPAAM